MKKKIIKFLFIFLFQFVINVSNAVEPDEILTNKKQELMARNISHNNLITFLFTILFISIPFVSFAKVTEEGVSSFRKSVNKILSNPCLRKNNYGLKIYSLDRGETLYEVRSDQLFIPASNTKILTTAVALKYLGHNYRYFDQNSS